MKTTSLLFATAVLLAGASAFGQPVIARGQVRLTGTNCPAALSKPALVPMEQEARAGDAGAVLFSGDFSRMRLAPGSEFRLYGGSVPTVPVLEAPLETPEATSAIKSINTQRIAERFFNEARSQVTHDGLDLRSGGVLVDQRRSAIDIRVGNATVSGAETRFAVTADTPSAARVTVAEGFVTISKPGEMPRRLRCGQFLTLSQDAAGHTLVGDPRSISESALSRADQAALFAGMASRLAPVGECVDPAGELEPVGEYTGPGLVGVPAVGAGPSVPFDLPAVGAGPTVPFDIPAVGTGPTVPFDLPSVSPAVP